MRLILSILICFLLVENSLAQLQYPQQYFRNPLDIPINLAGNFGECRPGHFHSGIDIKTEGRENLLVYAAAEGYVSRIKMEPGGFGHCIYINHPNGYTTVYAHLNDFVPQLQQVVKQAQYQNKSWKLDTTFSSEAFVVKKGELIAYSGNTGGSTAPHLHFEIRNTTTEHPLNPQLFGFEMLDKLPPKPTSIALYDASKSIYEQAVKRIQLNKKNDQSYFIQDTITVHTPSLLIGVAVNDYMNASQNTLSIYKAKWYNNDVLIGTLTLDDIGYQETRYLNACADYKLKYETSQWYQALYLLPNNKLSKIYALSNSNGKVDLEVNKVNQLKIVLEDVYNNKSVVTFYVKHIPQPVQEFKYSWIAGNNNEFVDDPNFQIKIDALGIYDHLNPQIKRVKNNGLSFQWRVNDPAVPLHTSALYRIKPSKAIPFTLTNKIAMILSDKRNKKGSAAQLVDGFYEANFREFGTCELVIDTIPPKIDPISIHGLAVTTGQKITFNITDQFTSVKKVTGTINGNWICMEQHGSRWFYTIDDYCPKGSQTLSIIAQDDNGNESKKQFSFIRK
jgi:hypothetical protein